MYKVTIESNKDLDKFFKRCAMYEEQIKTEIYNNINEIIAEKPHKIKTVRGYKYQGKTIYEYKIVLNKTFSCRVAYIFQEDEVIVFFISLTIIKAAFTKLVAGVAGVGKA